MIKALIMQLYDYVLFPYRILGLRTELLENLVATLINTLMIYTKQSLQLFFFFYGRKKGGKGKDDQDFNQQQSLLTCQI